MKQLLILATMLLTFGFANAQSKIYSKGGAYSSNIIGYYQDGKIYSKGGAYSSNIIGYYEGGAASAAAAAYALLF